MLQYRNREVQTLVPDGTPQKLVVLLHGYGADGFNLMPLAKIWTKSMKSVGFISPHAYEECEMGFGFQWFPSLRTHSKAQVTSSLQNAALSLSDFLTETAKSYSLETRDLVLVGFSQGAMLSLYTGIFELEVAGVVGFSGAFIAPEGLAPKYTPPVVLIHGDADDVLPLSYFNDACEKLNFMHITPRTLVIPGLGHSIEEQGLSLAEGFIQNHLNLAS